MGEKSKAAAGIECHTRRDLVHAIRRVLAQMGGFTLLGPDRGNLCRRATHAESLEFFGCEWIVEAQGLPNLIHEVVHALFLGHLADDHGFDYGAIPLDIERVDHRLLLWEELTCCGLSTSICAPLHTNPQQFARDWFAEQIEIQGVFHGLEHDHAAFCARIDAQLAMPDRVEELRATVARGHRRSSEEIGRAGGPPLPSADLLALWRDYRATRLAPP
ncbi:hypothetical protein [Enhygromyxa salina]|uniref:Uncharacterized protein n=1 Tax=Enhygromyxa salina TaxID=215803 RepID=A0A2S9YW15_9BACT|nr:hypothetical protein [Enhygromyxa salina]PRQ09301.1 hypothetical protein ENSA7_09930 [Enhygromyxa salina]